MLARRLERLVVARVRVPHDAGARVGREHPLEPLGRGVGAVGHHDHARVDRVADADAAAVVHAHPRRARRDVEQRVQDRPVGDRVRAVAHRLGLAVRRRDRARVEVVATDRRPAPDRARPDELVDREPGARTVAVAEPADPGRKTLERDSPGRQLEPAAEEHVVREELAPARRSIASMSAGSPESAAQRNGPTPRQKSGRI